VRRGDADAKTEQCRMLQYFEAQESAGPVSSSHFPLQLTSAGTPQ